MFERKHQIIIILVIIFAMIFSTIFAANISHFAPEYGITTANVNFRKAPNTDYSSFIRTLAPNTKVKIIGSIDNFYIIQLETNEVGIIYKDYTKVTGEKINSKTYIDYSPFNAKILENNTIVRGGPSTNYNIVTKLNAQDTVYVIGAIDNFLLVITQDNKVGMIRQDLVSQINNENNSNNTENAKIIKDNDTNAESDNKANVEYVLSRINALRLENGLPALVLDSLISTTAQNKAIDMVNNNYFAHESPTYGSPFEMLKNSGVIYKTAGENIAGNSNIDDAINSFIKSQTHRKNILSNSYTHIGIGIEPSEKYGYILVLMFVGRY